MKEVLVVLEIMAGTLLSKCVYTTQCHNWLLWNLGKCCIGLGALVYMG